MANLALARFFYTLLEVDFHRPHNLVNSKILVPDLRQEVVLRHVLSGSRTGNSTSSKIELAPATWTASNIK
jgi:hypothetical protein